MNREVPGSIPRDEEMQRQAELQDEKEELQRRQRGERGIGREERLEEMEER